METGVCLKKGIRDMQEEQGSIYEKLYLGYRRILSGPFR
jgi:hypothetical protein